MKKQLKSIVVSAVAFSLMVSAVGVSDSESQAAGKVKLDKSSVSVKVGKTKKINVKGVKAGKIKKTIWKSKSKKIATVKGTKTSATITGKKAGKTTVTAKITVKGKKPVTKKCTVKVSKDAKATPTPVATPTPNGSAATTAPADNGTPAPSVERVKLRELDKSYKDAKGPALIDYKTLPTSIPNQEIAEDEKIPYQEDFENLKAGEGDRTTAADATEECANGIRRFTLRTTAGSGDDADYLEVVDGSVVPEEPRPGNKMLKCHRGSESHSWQGPILNLKGQLKPGGTYRISFDIFSDCNVNFNEHVNVTDISDPSYAFMPNRRTESKWVGKRGRWESFKKVVSVPSDMYYYGLYWQSDGSEKSGDMYIDNMKLELLSAPGHTDEMASIKETYKDVFPFVAVGAGADVYFGTLGTKFINEQYNAMTPANEFKPESIMGKDDITAITVEEAKEKGFYVPDKYTEYKDNREDSKDENSDYILPDLDFDIIDKTIEYCHENNLKFRGHTLCWHAQMPMYFFQKNFQKVDDKSRNTSKENMDLRLEYFVKSVMNHVLEKDEELHEKDGKYALVAYDALNEYLHSGGTSKGNYLWSIYKTKSKTDPAYSADRGVTLHPTFAKSVFKWAHESLVEHKRTDVKLFYNDFSCYDIQEDIVHLVDYLNAKDDMNPDGEVLCDGIGMQTHLGIGSPTADKYAQCLECFRVNLPNTEVQITEWDAGSDPSSADYDQRQGAYYDQIMGTILQNKKKGGNITGLVIWGTHDGVSWLASNEPCICSGLFAPKSAFYALIDAKGRYWN